ncbi:unnamed protein product [Aphanomyces euteiches]|uniref:PX domain-containing protein n=1 Tax=Aphanomyces euteiches TaxID=100861 RepID=A0A6G0XY72_9STRA|nr:hypothetical protein Ae201684_000444 [Aphanomyces euteiches]KAH9091643.1 hypothetical protein Ae201684P_011187 [Aphanomyces euteiches]KAH9145986.1 hypothetical protein AeRB84_010098 [Aphanomyces euteiches]
MTSTMHSSHNLLTEDTAPLDGPLRPRLTSDILSVYTLSITCPVTKTRRIVVKRYAQFVFLRQQLTEIYRFAHSNSHFEHLEAALAPFMATNFPKKPRSTDSEDDILAREATFIKMLALLTTTRRHLVQHARAHPALSLVRNELKRTRCLLDDFLEIPSKHADAVAVGYTSLAEIVPYRRVEHPFELWILGLVQFFKARGF